MGKTRELVNQINDLKALQAVTEALTEISSSHVRGSRESVLKARDYYNEIGKVYYEVRLVYRDRILHARKSHKILLPSLQKNGKKVAICITSNIKFTRELNEALVRHFVDQTSKMEVERVVVGKMGDDILKEMRFAGSYSNYILKRDTYEDDINKLVDYVSHYSDIYVFYDQFVTVLTQEPVMKNIAQDTQSEELGVVPPRFIFEPELEKIMLFFETEILRGLLHQAFFESELSQFSRQLVQVENSTRNAEELIRKTKRQLARAKLTINNARQIERISAYALMNKI